MSLLDNDLYKFTMMQAVWVLHPKAEVSYEFISRRESDIFSKEAVDRIRQRVDELAELRFSAEELSFLGELSFFRRDFLEFLSDFQLQRDHVHIAFESEKLQIRITGSWVETILWEVPLMAIVSESYFELVDSGSARDMDVYYQKTLSKGLRLREAGCQFMDFGTRRRRSYATQDAVVRAFSNDFVRCAGTSNVHFAMKYGMKPIGTMAHEWIMGFAGLYGVADANRKALEAWREVYSDELSVALTDTYTTNRFFRDVRGDLAKNYEALRHDSEDPFEFADKVLEFYRIEGIDARTKGIVFSDGLSTDRAIAIQNHVAGRTRVSFGIGTDFTNDCAGSPALNIVIKLYQINGVKVAKLSDNPEKASGHPDAIAAALKAIGN